MFQKLQYILFFVVFVVSIFFVVSTLTFSGRLAEGSGSMHQTMTSRLNTNLPYIDYAANSWRVRWWLLDGWLSLLYFLAFGSIAYLWRPSANNSR
jgi:hypothetical protein